MRVKQQILKKRLQILGCRGDLQLQIIVICTDKRISEYQEFSAKVSFETMNPKVFKYLIMKTAVALVLPSQNGWICHMPEVNLEMCRTDSLNDKPSYENSFSVLKS
jgi:hypothetical protein